ncbi:hypothetical protein LOTGIDRAFT_153937 [Lottia gigantea]|uniref:Uncharacterized protein n=1 Tax=Lottia gigantea TaxID=225164 RepID=V3ZJN7_LOTGI|nr:hypothetical protein LOTGIDRAFT_153937 [Lottia gigantea]ESO91493.1 hypothetical protein LOTGIDRAFT_153937 [Lottia gigantea]
MAQLTEIGGIDKFNCSGDPTKLATRWLKWLRSFELYAEGKGVTDNRQKKSLLLHCGGIEMQDIFFTFEIPDPGEEIDMNFQHDELAIRDVDSERKGKGKLYTDEKRKVCESDLKTGDLVLLKQKPENKLMPNFETNPYRVISKYGSAVTVENNNGVRYKRNSTHVKKFIEKLNTTQSGNNSFQSVNVPTGAHSDSVFDYNSLDDIIEDDSIVRFDNNVNRKNQNIVQNRDNQNRNVSENYKSANVKSSQKCKTPNKTVSNKITKETNSVSQTTNSNIGNNNSTDQNSEIQINTRPTRLKRMPDRYTDYKMDK